MTRIVAKILLAATPTRLATALGATALATPSLIDRSLTISKPALLAAAIVVVVYWLVRPTEWQLRHDASDDDMMVVPLRHDRSSVIGNVIDEIMGVRSHRSVRRYGNPAGSEQAVQFEMDRSCMVLGETGSGKTEAINVLAHQMDSDPNEPKVAFDYKKDYQTFFNSSIRLSSKESDVLWNVFEEIRDEDDTTEITKAVFSTAEDNYFTKCAQQIFADVLILMRRRGEADGHRPTNKDLVEYLKSKDADGLREDLEAEGLSSAKHVSEDTEAADNIASNLEMQVSEVFSGDFGKEGEFSIRGYMDDPQGKTLILDLPADQSDSVLPIFRFLVDWSIRFGLSDERGSYYILDEFAALPRLSKLERLVNAGRAYNCYAILGVQAVSQVRDTYGKENANSVLSGLAQEIHLRVGEESVNYWRSRIGKVRTEHTDDEGIVTRVTEDYPVSEQEVQNLPPGKAAIHTTEGWQRGRLYMLSEIEGDLLPSDSSFLGQMGSIAARLGDGETDSTELDGTDHQPLPDD